MAFLRSDQKKNFDLSIVLDCLKNATKFDDADSADSQGSGIDPPSSSQAQGASENAEIVTDFRFRSRDELGATASDAVAESLAITDVVVEEYLKAFTELTRFFVLTGPIFKFVAHDLTKKISAVQTHLNSTNRSNYLHLKSLMEYELANDTARNKSSATRTMLRLHWALEFIVEFMDKLKDSTAESKASTLVYDVYRQTLYNHHPWFTRQLAYFAVFTLPSIRKLIDIMCKQDYEEVRVLLVQVVEVGRPILRYTSDIYKLHRLSDIS